MTRSLVVGGVLALGLAGLGVAMSLTPVSNPGEFTGSNPFTAAAESSALYCTGLGTGSGAGHVVFTNLTNSARELSVQVVADNAQSATRGVALGAHASIRIAPQNWLKSGHYFGVSAVVSGGGVIGAEVTTNSTAVAPCSSGGVTSWVASGFDTQVGSTAIISLLNPSATPAVVNLTTMDANGFAAPATFQGMSIGPHAQIAVNLGSQIVDTDNVGVRLNVVNGAVVVTGVQSGPSGTSFAEGQLAASSKASFPAVTTASAATAQVRVANPNDAVATVSVAVDVPGFSIAPRTLRVRAFSSGLISITPNTAIPAAGFASLRLSANVPVISSLAVGSKAGWGLSSPAPSASQWLLSDFAGNGFSRVELSAPKGRAVRVTVRDVASSRSASATFSGAQTTSLAKLVPDFANLRGLSVLITSDRPVNLTCLLPAGRVSSVVSSALYSG